MHKLIAIACVVSWSGFWAFGYLALSADPIQPQQMISAALLAAISFLIGTFTWMSLARRDI